MDEITSIFHIGKTKISPARQGIFVVELIETIIEFKVTKKLFTYFTDTLV